MDLICIKHVTANRSYSAKSNVL